MENFCKEIRKTSALGRLDLLLQILKSTVADPSVICSKICNIAGHFLLKSHSLALYCIQLIGPAQICREVYSNSDPCKITLRLCAHYIFWAAEWASITAVFSRRLILVEISRVSLVMSILDAVSTRKLRQKQLWPPWHRLALLKWG